MRKYLGAWLCIALGAVLITTGLTSGAGGSVGVVVTHGCGTTVVGVANPCPTAVLTVQETTVRGSGNPAVAPSGGWTVHVTSACPNTTDGTMPMDETLTVPDNGSVSSSPLFVYPDTTDSTKCQYTLAENAVTGFTAGWTPSASLTLDSSGGIGMNATVALRNTSPAVAVKTTPASTTHAPATTSDPGDPGAIGGVSASASPTSSDILAATGPRRPVSTTLLLGLALVALGAVLLLAGRIERRRARPRH